MKSILLLIYDYFPNPSANTLVIQNLVDYLREKGFRIHVLCIKSELNSLSTESLRDGLYVYRVFKLEDWFARKIKKLHGTFGKFLKYFLVMFYKTVSLLGNCGYTKCYNSNKVYNQGCRIIDTQNIDIMLAVSYPFSTFQLACRIKNHYPSVKWVGYEFDPFAYNFTLPVPQLAKRKEKEVNILQHADFILSTIGIDEYNQRMGFRQQFEKMTKSISLPGLKVEKRTNVQDSIINYQNHAINMVFTGQFYGEIRSPLPLLKLMKDSAYNIYFHIIGGEIEHFLSGFEELTDRIMIYPYMDKHICDASIIAADIAVNFDNKIPNQAPSKILTYMALGKPIINFYYRGCNVGETYLENYHPHISMCVDSVVDAEAIEKLNNFLTKYSKFKRKPSENFLEESSISNESVCNNIFNILLRLS